MEVFEIVIALLVGGAGRADGTIGDTAFQQIEQELDWEEL